MKNYIDPFGVPREAVIQTLMVYDIIVTFIGMFTVDGEKNTQGPYYIFNNYSTFTLLISVVDMACNIFIPTVIAVISSEAVSTARTCSIGLLFIDDQVFSR